MTADVVWGLCLRAESSSGMSPVSKRGSVPFVVMVCGSRGWKDERAIGDALMELQPDLVIEGGAEGADTLGRHVARFLNIRTETYLPLKSLPSPRRYHARNDEMLDAASYVLAFWDGVSRGTKSVIDKANSRGIPYKVVTR